MQVGTGNDMTTALCSETTEPEFFFYGEKTIKKQEQKKHAFKNYAHAYYVEILNFLNPELEIKNTESAIKNKQKKLLTELRGFKYFVTLVLKFKTKTTTTSKTTNKQTNKQR